MMHIVKGYVTYEQSPYSSKPKIDFQSYKPSVEYFPHTVVVREHWIEVEIPDDFNPVPDLIASLEEKKRLLRVKLAEELATIDDRISKLSAICYDAEPV